MNIADRRCHLKRHIVTGGGVAGEGIGVGVDGPIVRIRPSQTIAYVSGSLVTIPLGVTQNICGDVKGFGYGR